MTVTDPAVRVTTLPTDDLVALHDRLDTSTVEDPATVEAHHLVSQEMLKRGLDHGHENDQWSRAVIVVDEAQVSSVDDIEFPGDLAEPLVKALEDGGIVQVLLTVDGYVLKAEPNVNSVHVDSIMGAKKPKAMLKRIVERDGKYVVMAEKTDREFGTYDTREQAEERLAQMERFSKEESYKVPDAVRSAARRAVEWISEGKAGDGFTSVGRNRARQLADGGTVGRDTLVKMRAYFARHGKQRGDHARLDDGEPTPWRVAWDAWGGDAGRAWVRSMLGDVEKATDTDVDEEELLSTMDADDLSDFGSYAYLSDKMEKRGNPEALRDYWREGGEGQISWGSGGDFTSCVFAVSRYMEEEQAKGYCAIRHYETTGMWPGDARNRAQKSADGHTITLMEIPSGGSTFTLPDGSVYTFGLPVAKHGSHDQKDHGNWASGGDYGSMRARRAAAMAQGDTKRPVPRDANGRVINPDATGGYKAGIPESVSFKGETLTPEHSLWHHLESDGAGGYRITQERAALHRSVVEDATRGVPPSDDPTFYMLGGGPAAGKTTAINSGLADTPSRENAVQINADDVKAQMPEFERMRMSDNDDDFFNAAAFSHEESSYLAKQVQKAALANRQDVVLDGTGDSTPDKLEKKIGQAREGGYKVVGVYATVPTSDAVSRSNQRSLKEGERRFVPEAVVRGTHRDVSRALPEAIKGGWFDRVTLIDTSTRGSANKIGSGSGTSWKVNDQAAWDAFLAKGDE
jgi:hypothetical protein